MLQQNETKYSSGLQKYGIKALLKKINQKDGSIKPAFTHKISSSAPK